MIDFNGDINEGRLSPTTFINHMFDKERVKEGTVPKLSIHDPILITEKGHVLGADGGRK